MDSNPQDYYDALAPYYKYVYSDWEQSVSKQAQQLDKIIKTHLGNKKNLLDAACGIGTQAIG